jgi:hypothetical protein
MVLAGLIVGAPSVLALGVYHFTGYRTGGRYDRWSAQMLAAREKGNQ